MYQCSKKLVKYKEYSFFDHSNLPERSMFTFDVSWGSLGTSIFGNLSSAANNTGSRLSFRLSFRFLWLWLEQRTTTIWKQYRKPIHYYDWILIKHSQPRSIFHFQLMWEVLLKFKMRYCRGVEELKTLQLNHQCV